MICFVRVNGDIVRRSVANHPIADSYRKAKNKSNQHERLRRQRNEGFTRASDPKPPKKELLKVPPLRHRGTHTVLVPKWGGGVRNPCCHLVEGNRLVEGNCLMEGNRLIEGNRLVRQWLIAVLGLLVTGGGCLYRCGGLNCLH